MSIQCNVIVCNFLMDNYSVLVFEIEIEIHSVIEVLCIILIILSLDGMNKKGFDVK